MASKSCVYLFSGFRLDTSAKSLFLDGKAVRLTPKVYETLLVFLENPGNLISKDAMMQAIWPDRFVEESNLTFNIKILRKALGDSASSPVFIETIPRRGYRFIAGVEIEEEGRSKAILGVSGHAHSYSGPRAKPSMLFLISLTLASALALTAWGLRSNVLSPEGPVFRKGAEVIKLSETGKALHIAITPDGRKMVYSNGANRKQSIWVRNIASGDNSEIIPGAGYLYYGIALSNDGETIYFTRKPEDGSEPLSIFKMPFSGGIPAKIAERCEGWISLPSDGRFITCVRYEPGSSRNMLLLIDTENGSERLIRESEAGLVYWAHDISPDGKKIAAAYGHSNNGSQMISLVEIDTETGNQRDITPEKFFEIGDIEWLPGQNGILHTARENISGDSAIKLLAYPSGKTETILKDSASYNSLSIDEKGEKLLATTITADFRLGTIERGSSGNIQWITQARDNLCFLEDGSIVFASDASGNEDIWISGADGSLLRQLTTDTALDAYPYSGEDGRIYFVSNRTGEHQLWRMNKDGSRQEQLTKNYGGLPLYASADGNKILFNALFAKGLHSLEPGVAEEKPVFESRRGFYFAVPANGGEAAYLKKNRETGKYEIEIARLADGGITKRFSIPDGQGNPYYLSWRRDLGFFSYTTKNNAGQNILWIQAENGESPEKAAEIGSDELRGCKISPDGKKIAFISGSWKHDVVMLNGLK